MTFPDGLGDDVLWSRAAAFLVEAEQHIRFLERVLPQNFGPEHRRLQRALERDERAEAAFEYASSPDFNELGRGLERLARKLEALGALGQLHAERAEELLLELRLCECLGAPEFATLAAERYPAPPSPELDALVERFEGSPPDEPSEFIRAGDETHPQSLVSVLRSRIGSLRLPVRVEVRLSLPSTAAAGDGFVVVRDEALLSARASQRVACHELLGHVLPRLLAKKQHLGIYRAGTRRANEDEEGRALCIEERLGLWDGARLVELACRHRVAVAVRAGATLNEIVRELGSNGIPLRQALGWALRALRGGGLAREIVYLPAYLRLSRAFASDASAERYFERGRVSLTALPALRAAEFSR